VTAIFAIGALVVSTAIAALSYQFIRSSLLAERERTATRTTFYDATVVHARLGPTADAVDVLGVVDAGSSRRPLLHTGGRWYALSTDTVASADIPVALQQMVEGGQAGDQRVHTASGPAIVVGVPLSDGTEFYEIVSLTETEQTLDLIGLVLCLVAAGVTVAGAGLGWYTGRMALRPLVDMAHAARGIAAGDLSARLDRMADPDLAPLSAAFNDMVEQLEQRIERDRRFAADVSHELRSPLQTLAAAAAVLNRRAPQLDERSAAAAQLVVEEVDRFQHLVTDLLEITRADSKLDLSDVDVLALARDLCRSRGIDPSIVVVGRGAESTWRADGRRVEQIVGNLLDNAQGHGGGAVSVRLRQRRGRNVIEVDDDGPGVLAENREVIFRPFVRGPGAERRGDTVGAGLGLAIVARLADSLGGRASVTDRPGGGARFRVILARRPS
jgi:signal transduction histidine kinase